MKNQSDKSYETALQELRQQIDGIDDEIIEMFSKRMEVIKKVAKLKTDNGEKFFIRSSREADMIKTLLEKFSKKNADATFSKSAVVSIWRKLITAANMLEQPLRVAIHNPKNLSDYEHLVRGYYSDEVPIFNFDSATNIVAEIEKKQIEIGVFSLPKNDADDGEKKEDAKENWWISLANNRLGLRVFTKIPFVEFSGEKNLAKIQLVAVAIKEPEKSTSDQTLLYVEASKEVSRSQILSSLKDASINGKILKSAKIQQFDGVVFYLVELDGFYLESDVAIKNLTKSKAKLFVKILGHFPTSIVM